ncbi:CoA-transferase [Pseudonocardia sp.]|uniref:CoA-transferase n=1 Tax=Pseudonocardia sp. TaxID=60912 RepID=UPI0031FBAD0A
MRAEAPDVAFVHVDLADPAGNAVVREPLGEVVVAVQAAHTTVVVTEELTSTAVVRAEGITLPGLLVSAVVHEPGAVAPDGALGRYDRDVAAYERYARLAATPEGFQDWLEQDVLPATAARRRE